jgi:hypothetical protein
MISDKFLSTRFVVCVSLSLSALMFTAMAFPFAMSNSDVERRLNGLERDQSTIHTEHYQIMQQVATNTKALADLTDIVDKHHEAQAGYPAFLATLDTKLNILLGVASTLLAGGAGWMWNRKKYSDKLADELREHARRVFERQAVSDQSDFSNHQTVMGRLQEVETEAHQAYSEANTVNQKISSIGMEMRDHKLVDGRD